MSKYPSELTLALDGEVTPDALAKAAAAFARLLNAITREEAPNVPLEWIVSDMHPGSSAITAECRALDPREARRVPKIIARGQRFGEAMEHGNGLAERSPELAGIEAEFRQLPNQRLVRVRLETPEQDYVLAGFPRTDQAQPEAKVVAWGSIPGRVQAMNSHGSLRFTLYDLNDDKGVSCYLPSGTDSEQMMLGLWGKLVEVEGRITRDAETGKPMSIREIAEVLPLEDSLWRNAVRAAPGFLGDERSEDVIRRARGDD